MDVIAANALRAQPPFVRCVNWGARNVAMSADAEVQPTPGRQRSREIAEEERARFHPGNNRPDFSMGSTNHLMPLLGAGRGRSDNTKSKLSSSTDAVSNQQKNRRSALANAVTSVNVTRSRRKCL